MIEAREEGARALRRRDGGDEGREFGGRVRLCGVEFGAASGERRGRREREERVLPDGDERVDEGRVERSVELVRSEKERARSSSHRRAGRGRGGRFGRAGSLGRDVGGRGGGRSDGRGRDAGG